MTDRVLHALAFILLRVSSPQRAYAILTRVGAVLPPHADRSALLRANMRLRPRGTCLSRALAVAARAPNAELVIGVAPPAGRGLLAHAWLELSGEPIDPSDVAGDEIVRLRHHRVPKSGPPRVVDNVAQ
jgi:transglutaminase superfamily protein